MPVSDVGNPLARERDDSFDRGQHLTVGIEKVAQARVQGGVGIGPGGEDGTHQGASLRHGDAQLGRAAAVESEDRLVGEHLQVE